MANDLVKSPAAVSAESRSPTQMRRLRHILTTRSIRHSGLFRIFRRSRRGSTDSSFTQRTARRHNSLGTVSRNAIHCFLRRIANTSDYKLTARRAVHSPSSGGNQHEAHEWLCPPVVRTISRESSNRLLRFWRLFCFRNKTRLRHWNTSQNRKQPKAVENIMRVRFSEHMWNIVTYYHLGGRPSPFSS